MKISLKELLRLEKYLNGLGRRINKFGIDGDEKPMEVEGETKKRKRTDKKEQDAAEKRQKNEELPLVTTSNLNNFENYFDPESDNYKSFQALKKLIEEKSTDQIKLNNIVNANRALMKEAQKPKNYKSITTLKKLKIDIFFLEHMRNKLQGYIDKQTSDKLENEDVNQSSSSQSPPLKYIAVDPQPPFEDLVGQWVYHPQNKYSPFSDYIGKVEKYGDLREGDEENVPNITIIWIPSSADYQNIGKKNICADIDNPENCNATTTDNCEWKKATARSKGKCVVRDEVKCTGLNETVCNNTDTCDWNGKKCTKKIMVDNIDNFLKYNYIIDDLNEKEYEAKGIQVIEKPTYGDINTITITVDQDNGIYLKLLAQLDAIKDFYGSGGSDYYNILQLNILRNYINGIIQTIPKTDEELIRLLNLFTAGTDKSNDRNRRSIMESIYVELEEKLGIQSYTLEGITYSLFPMKTSHLKNKKEQIERFVLYHLNNETLAGKLKATSDKYNGIQNDEDKNRFIDIYTNPENYMTGLDEMIVWVEGSANRNNISTLVPMLSFNDIRKRSPRSFATYIDAAAKTNILTDSIGYIDVSTIGIDGPQVRYNIQTNNNGELLISFRVKRIDTQASTNNPLYVVEIDNFFGLDCTDVGPLAYIGPNISISGVWDRIKMLLFNSTEKLINNEKRNTQVDLCMKANKTLMDMLKGIITMEYKKLQAGRNTVIFSVFPDLNGARFMAANSSDGVTLHTVSSRSPRIFLKKRIFDILFDRTMDFGKKKMNEIDYLIKLVKRM
jgi:hypothetical protein